MPPVRVVVDSLADIPPALAQELDISVVPCIVRFGEVSFRDKVDLTMAEFYKRLAGSGDLPTTSQPPSAAFEQVYRELAEKTDQIYSIHVVSALSGTYNSALAGSRQVPEVTIRVVDSRQVTMAYGWLAILAARGARQGRNLDEIDQIVHDALPRAHVLGALETLEYARRGGRLGRAAALAGALLNVKPIISIENGQVAPVEKVRTRARALDRLVELALASGPIQEMAVLHAVAPDQAEILRRALEATLPGRKIVVTETGPALGTHVGPGAVGLAWLNARL